MLAQAPNSSGTRGSILLMGSVTASDPAPEFFATHAYAAAKGATTALMTTMAATYAADRIRVNAVAPSVTDTPMAARAAATRGSARSTGASQPLAGEMMDPDEVAHAAVYFLSDESRVGDRSAAQDRRRMVGPRVRAIVTFVRTVLGDIDPSELGVTYAHEHLVIDGGRPVLMEPDFDLADVDAMATEVGAATALGLRAVVDAMPCDAGRNATKLAELSRRTGVHVIAPTGLHHDRYYGPAHWSAPDRGRGAGRPVRAPTSTTASTPTTTRVRSSGGPPIAPGSSRWPAATADRRRGIGGCSRRRRRPIGGPGPRS